MKRIINKVYEKIVPFNIRNIIHGFNHISKIREIETMKKEILYLKIMHYLNNNSEEYKDEKKYLNLLGTLAVFPYKRTNKELDIVNGDFDRKRKMPFVYHKGNKLFFPSHFSLEKAKSIYLNYIVKENILEGDYIEKRPHQYTTESFFIKNGDIVLDIGGAEGLFLLNAIDKIKKGYIFESEKFWIDALKATFEPFKEKVIIINKFASNTNSSNTVTIDSCLENQPGDVFIKMDAEGSEMSVLKGAENVVNRKNDIRIACCTYHKNNDAELLESFFKSINYQTEFSDGYMLFFYDEELKAPYFRKGLIRANKRNTI